MMHKSYHIFTFGCAMNEYDTERIGAALERYGLYNAGKSVEADVVILNTCSVREKPQAKISSYLGKLRVRKEKGEPILIGITGCVAQQEGEKLLENPWVDFVMGTEAFSRLDDIIERAFRGERFADVSVETDNYSISGFHRKKSISAYVTVMKGCENFCSYCIVPFVRGKEASRKPSEIIDEIKKLADNGTAEICLLGQNVNSYGKGLEENIDFSDLLKMADRVPGIKRIRFLTSHPKDYSEKMINTIAECDKICNFIHLPLQSGSDKVLEKMNRGYSFAEYAAKIDFTKKTIPDVSFSSDFIVGFPGETEEDFVRTLYALEYVGYDQVFAFCYSPRPMTAAFSMKDGVTAEEKSARLNRLFEIQNSLYSKKLASLSGSVMELMVTGRGEKGPGNYLGKNICNRTINFSSVKDIAEGDLVKIKVTKTGGNFLSGSEV